MVVKINDAVVSSGALKVEAFSPGIFSATADGMGIAAGKVQRVRSGNSIYEEMVERDPNDATKWRAIPIDLDLPTDNVFLLLFGTGLRSRSNPLNASVSIGGMTLSVDFVGAQPEYVGLDQVNILLPQSLKGKGEVDVILTVDGVTMNTVKVRIK